VLQPFVRDDNLVMALQLALDPACLPVPEHHVSFAISATYPFPIWGEAYLTGVSRDGVARKPLLAILSEVVRVIKQNLIVQRLRSKDFFCRLGLASGVCEQEHGALFG